MALRAFERERANVCDYVPSCLLKWLNIGTEFETVRIVGVSNDLRLIAFIEDKTTNAIPTIQRNLLN